MTPETIGATARIRPGVTPIVVKHHPECHRSHRPDPGEDRVGTANRKIAQNSGAGSLGCRVVLVGPATGRAATGNPQVCGNPRKAWAAHRSRQRGAMQNRR
jgi:hypothetical protein